MKIGFQGIRGAYSELALYRHFGRDITAVGFDSFDEIYEALDRGEVDRGFVPVENTIAGTVVENYDLLLSENCTVVAEAYMPVCHTLLGKKGITVSEIREAYSHPHALKQCRDFLKKQGIIPQPKYDTAGAAQMIAGWDRTDAGAIASELCAEIYGLDILAENIQTNDTNTTRFLVVAREAGGAPASGPRKTTLAFKTRHYPGALVDCLIIFRDNALNLSKLESRPVPENPWEYVFYTDLEGGADDPTVRHALDELQENALFVKIIGSYPVSSSS